MDKRRTSKIYKIESDLVGFGVLFLRNRLIAVHTLSEIEANNMRTEERIRREIEILKEQRLSHSVSPIGYILTDRITALKWVLEEEDEKSDTG